MDDFKVVGSWKFDGFTQIPRKNTITIITASVHHEPRQFFPPIRSAIVSVRSSRLTRHNLFGLSVQSFIFRWRSFPRNCLDGTFMLTYKRQFVAPQGIADILIICLLYDTGRCENNKFWIWEPFWMSVCSFYCFRIHSYNLWWNIFIPWS